MAKTKVLYGPASAPHPLCRGRFFVTSFEKWDSSRRGGGGADVGKGPLWPPIVEIKNVLIRHHQPSVPRAATRAPSPPNSTPAPTRIVPLTSLRHSVN